MRYKLSPVFLRLTPSYAPEPDPITGAYPKSQMSRNPKLINMPKFVIEREIPGAGNLSAEQLKTISQTSCAVLQEMGPQINWVQSYVTTDKIYCIYNAPNEDMLREHAKRGGFPIDKISKIATIIDPVTAEDKEPVPEI